MSLFQNRRDGKEAEAEERRERGGCGWFPPFRPCPPCPPPCEMGATGPAGVSEAQDLLSAYSAPPQPGTSGSALIFDRNALSYGTAVRHSAGSGAFVIQKPGFYFVSFHGSLSPVSGSDFPLTLTFYLEENGIIVQGTAVYHTFHTSSDLGNASFAQIIEVADVPTTIEVIGAGGTYLYANVSISIFRLGENQSTAAINEK